MIGHPLLLSTEPSLQPLLHFFFSFVFSGYEGGTLWLGQLGAVSHSGLSKPCWFPTGRQCEVLSPCIPSLCEHGGHCESDPGQLTVCSCPPGWQGKSVSPLLSFFSSSPSTPSLLPPSPFPFPSFPAPHFISGDAGKPKGDPPLLYL